MQQAEPDRLYSLDQVLLAAVLGSPLASAWFLAHNYRVLGSGRARTLALWLGVPLSILTPFAILAALLRFVWLGPVLQVAFVAAIRLISSQLQGRSVDAFVDRGGRLISTSSAFAMIAICWVVLLFGLALLASAAGILAAIRYLMVHGIQLDC